MAKIIDLFKKKKDKQLSYEDRKKICDNNVMLNGFCECSTCIDKGIIAERLTTISNYLVLDYVKKTGNQLYNRDWLEIVIAASLIVQEYVYPQKQD